MKIRFAEERDSETLRNGSGTLRHFIHTWSVKKQDGF